MEFFVNPLGYVKVRAGYDGEVFQVVKPHQMKPLDPIDKSLVGQLRVTYAENSGFFKTLADIIRVAVDEGCVVINKDQPRWPQIKACYLDHIKAMGIIRSSHRVEQRLLQWKTDYLRCPRFLRRSTSCPPE